MEIRRRPLVAGAAVLAAAGLATRLIGTFYRVLLVRYAGETVLGLFQLTMPLFRLLSTVGGFGLPVAIAQRAAQARGQSDPARAERIERAGLAMIAVFSTIIAMGLALSARFWAEAVLATPDTEAALRALALLLIPGALSAGLRGVLQSRQRLMPNALSQLVEAAARAPFALYLVSLLLPQGPAAAAAGIACALAAGEVLSALVLWLAVRRKRGRGTRARMGRVRFVAVGALPIGRSLLGVALPVTGSGMLNAGIGVITAALIPRQLAAAGLGPEGAVSAYGQLSGMALPLLYMPMVAIHPIVAAVLPAVSHRLAGGDRRSVRRLLVQAFAAASAVATGTALALALFSRELGSLLYGAPDLAPLVRPLALAAPFVYLGHVASGILYGLGRTGQAMAHTLAGNLLRLALIYALAGRPEWGILGALWAAVADSALTGALHLAALPKALREGTAPDRN